MVPDCKTDFSHDSVAGCWDSVSLGSKVSGDGIKDRQEPLGLGRRFEALHPPLALSSWLMGVLSPVVQSPPTMMSHVAHYVLLCALVAGKLIGHDLHAARTEVP